MGKEFFSVIVPVYNAEKYLIKCVDSILNQDYSTFELILVDDGSADNSAMLCDEYAKRDSRVHVLHKKNEGILKARLSGVMIAQNEYVTFADADDWLDDGTFSYVAQIISADWDLDLLDYGYRYNEDGKVFTAEYNSGEYNAKAINDYLIEGMMFDYKIGRRRISPSLCSKFIRKSLYLSIASKITDEITLGEDAIITYPAICMAKKIYLSDKCLYHYRTNNTESCTHIFPPNRVLQIANFKDNFARILREIGRFDDLRYQLESYVRDFVEMFSESWFSMNPQGLLYLFPQERVPQDSKVIIYGAGTVGESYIKYCKIKECVDIVACVDKQYADLHPIMGMAVSSPEILLNTTFDYVVIAITSKQIAMEIKKLIKEKYFVEEEKIIWEQPIYLR